MYRTFPKPLKVRFIETVRVGVLLGLPLETEEDGHTITNEDIKVG